MFEFLAFEKRAFQIPIRWLGAAGCFGGCCDCVRAPAGAVAVHVGSVVRNFLWAEVAELVVGFCVRAREKGRRSWAGTGISAAVARDECRAVSLWPGR